MVSLKGTELSLCSVALLSSCWHVSRVFNTWYHFVWVFYDNPNLHPACCFMGTSVSANSPPFCTPCFQSDFSLQCKMNLSCFPFQSSSAGLLCQPRFPFQPTLVSVAGLSWLQQDCMAGRARTGSLCILMAGNQQRGVLVVTHRVGTAQDLTHRHWVTSALKQPHDTPSPSFPV